MYDTNGIPLTQKPMLTTALASPSCCSIHTVHVHNKGKKPEECWFYKESFIVLS